MAASHVPVNKDTFKVVGLCLRACLCVCSHDKTTTRLE